MPATAAGRTDAMLQLCAAEVLQDPFQGAENRLPAHALAIAGEMPGFDDGFLLVGPREAHRAHGLLAAAAARAGDPGDRERERALRPRERAFGHLARGLLAHRTVLLQGVRADAEELLFRSIRVGDEAALEPVRRTGDRGHGLCDPAA